MYTIVTELLDAGDLEIGEDDLSQPFTLTWGGQIVTLREAIRSFGSTDLRDSLRIDAPDSDNASSVRAISTLNEDELKGLAASMLEACKDDTQQSISGLPSLTPSQLREEVLAGSSRGKNFIEIFRLHALLLEEAIRRDKLKIVENRGFIDVIPLDF